MTKPTNDQLSQVQRRIAAIGRDNVNNYLHKFYPNADIDHLTKKQAQKIITGIEIPRPVYKNYEKYAKKKPPYPKKG